MRVRWFEGILVWVVIAGIAMVGLAIGLLHVFDRQIIEQAGAKNLHTEFLRAASSVSRVIQKSGDIHNIGELQEAFHYIFEIRPGIRRLSVFELLPDSSALIYSSDPASVPVPLSDYERSEIAAGRSVTHFDLEGSDRGWLIVAPLLLNGEVAGALRGRFSLWKYDGLIQQEGQLAKDIGVGAVIVTSLVFLGLIRLKVHRPIRALLGAMRRAERGELSSKAPLTGPADIQEVAYQFNQMLDRVREALAAKEQLLEEVRHFNETLVRTVAETKEELDQTNLLLVEARIQTERASKLAALGELSAVMAHELGNPLNAIGGHLQLLQRELVPTELHRHLAIIRTEIDRMVTIIQHILESTRLPVRPAPVDINQVVQEVGGLISPTLFGSRVALKTNLADSLPPVAGDHRTLHGMIFNLAINAIQAMPDGGELEITTSPCIDDYAETTAFFQGPRVKEGAVRLTVRDSGCGIAPGNLNRIFEPFFTTRHHEGGTGLGLAICHRVALSLGGRIGVTSTTGHGTRFFVDLPPWEDRDKGGSLHES